MTKKEQLFSYLKAVALAQELELKESYSITFFDKTYGLEIELLDDIPYNIVVVVSILDIQWAETFSSRSKNLIITCKKALNRIYYNIQESLKNHEFREELNKEELELFFIALRIVKKIKDAL